MFRVVFFVKYPYGSREISHLAMRSCDATVMSSSVSVGDSSDQESVVSKRPRSPTRCSPQSQSKRVPLRDLAEANNLPSRAPRLLPSTLTFEEVDSNKQPKSKVEWSNSKLKALTEFVLFHTTDEAWPSHKQMTFWKSAGEFVKNRGGVDSINRSGKCYKHCSLFMFH